MLSAMEFLRRYSLPVLVMLLIAAIFFPYFDSRAIAVVALVVLLVFVAFLWSWFSNRKRSSILEGFARKHGLFFKPGTFSSSATARGSCKGRYSVCRYQLEKTSGRGFGYFYFSMQVKTDFRMMVSRRNFFENTRMKRDIKQDSVSLNKIKEIKTGDPEFDKMFFVVANNPEKAREFLSPDVKTKLKQFLRVLTSQFTIGRDVVEAKIELSFFNREKLEKLAEFLSSACNKLEKPF